VVFDLISAQETFDQAYLAQFRKSELEVISELFVRDFRMARNLPKEQRVALANLIRDKIDGLELM
jgi:hypothetical protein